MLQWLMNVSCIENVDSFVPGSHNPRDTNGFVKTCQTACGKWHPIQTYAPMTIIFILLLKSAWKNDLNLLYAVLPSSFADLVTVVQEREAVYLVTFLATDRSCATTLMSTLFLP